MNIEFYKSATDTNVESHNRAGSYIRGMDGYSLTPDILLSTWNKIVDVNNADKLLAIYEQHGLGNSAEASALRANREVHANAEASLNIKTSSIFTDAQIRAMADASVVVTPQEHAERMTARAVLNAKTAEERIAAERALAGGHGTQVKFLNGLKNTSGALGGLAIAGSAALALAAGGSSQAEARPRVTFQVGR